MNLGRLRESTPAARFRDLPARASDSDKPASFSVRRRRRSASRGGRVSSPKTDGGNAQSEGEKFRGYFSDARARKSSVPQSVTGATLTHASCIYIYIYTPMYRACNGVTVAVRGGGAGRRAASRGRGHSPATRPLVSDTIHWTRESS